MKIGRETFFLFLFFENTEVFFSSRKFLGQLGNLTIMMWPSLGAPSSDILVLKIMLVFFIYFVN